MPLITWTDKYSVMVPSIDNQHKKLVNLINDLHEAMVQGKSKEIISRVLNNLVIYTKEHFTYEEGLMQKAKYSSIISHKTQHNNFVEKIKDFQNKFAEGKVSLSIEVLNFLKQWLNDHIMVTDKAYTTVMTTNNIK